MTNIHPVKLAADIIRQAVLSAQQKEQTAQMFLFSKRAEILLTFLDINIQAVRSKLNLPEDFYNAQATATTTDPKQIVLWQQLFNTDTVPLKTPAPFIIQGTEQIAYQLDTEALTTQQQQNLTDHLAAKLGHNKQYIAKHLKADGLPILAQQLIVTITQNGKEVYKNENTKSTIKRRRSTKKKQPGQHRHLNEKSSISCSQNTNPQSSKRRLTLNPNIQTDPLATIPNQAKHLPV